jgi:hypothetical protein
VELVSGVGGFDVMGIRRCETETGVVGIDDGIIEADDSITGFEVAKMSRVEVFATVGG